jgi:transcriptional regulator with XRE-family HTH domain
VSSQQAHKYESGTNRLPVDRLWQAAAALDVAVSTFFEGLEIAPRRPGHMNGDRVFLDLARHYRAIPHGRGRDYVELIARLLAESGRVVQGERQCSS